MKFLSFDCANKSLAYMYADIDVDIMHKIRNIADIINLFVKSGKRKTAIVLYSEFLSLANNFITFIEWGVVDVLEGKKVKDVSKEDRKALLLKALDKISQPDKDAVVIIEKQPALMNHKTNDIEENIRDYYSAINPFQKIVFISPLKKNKLNFTNNPKIYEQLVSKYSKKYDANKELSRVNLSAIIMLTGANYLLDGIKRANYDDIADAILQIFAYILFELGADFDIEKIYQLIDQINSAMKDVVREKK